MAQVADGGDVAKDPEEIELALLGHRGAQTLAKSELSLSHLAGVGIVGRGAGRLAHLLLDLFQKLLDPDRGGHRLRALDPDDRVAGSLGRRSRDRPGSTPSAPRRPARQGRRRICERGARAAAGSSSPKGIGTEQDLSRHGEAEQVRGLEVHREVDPLGAFDRQVLGPGSPSESWPPARRPGHPGRSSRGRTRPDHHSRPRAPSRRPPGIAMRATAR